jgi:hypothetical protein
MRGVKLCQFDFSSSDDVFLTFDGTQRCSSVAVSSAAIACAENTRKTTQISLVKGEVCPDFALA